jgi:hypothetical protein
VPEFIQHYIRLDAVMVFNLRVVYCEP